RKSAKSHLPGPGSRGCARERAGNFALGRNWIRSYPVSAALSRAQPRRQSHTLAQRNGQAPKRSLAIICKEGALGLNEILPTRDLRARRVDGSGDSAATAQVFLVFVVVGRDNSRQLRIRRTQMLAEDLAKV